MTSVLCIVAAVIVMRKAIMRERTIRRRERPHDPPIHVRRIPR